jgi:hypothetical protein
MGREKDWTSLFWIELMRRFCENLFEQQPRMTESPFHTNRVEAELAAQMRNALRGQNVCPECRRNTIAKANPNATELREPAAPYHPNQCPYLRRLMADLENWLARNPSMLREWHRRAVERYGK